MKPLEIRALKACPLRWHLAMALFGMLGSLIPSKSAEAQSVWQERPATPLIRTRPVVLARPVDLEYPNFVSDLNGALMSAELMAQLDGIVNARLGVARAQYGFNSLNGGFYALQKDGVTRRPYGLTTDEEYAIQREMAHTVKRYVLFRGLPKFLASRTATKPLAQAYETAMGFTRVQLRSAPDPVTQRVWTYSTGIDPFKLLLWAKADNEAWLFEASRMLKQTGSLSLMGAYRWRLTTLNTVFVYPQKTLGQSVRYLFTPQLSGTLGISYSVNPNRVQRLAQETLRTVSMSYAF